MTKTKENERLEVVEEDGNKFWRLLKYNHRFSSLKYELDTTCFTRGVSYNISSRVRYRNIGGSESYYWYISFLHASDEVWKSQDIVDCDVQSVDDDWVRCSGNFTIDEDFSETSKAYLMLAFHNYRDGGQKYDLDVDDISLRYHQGYTNNLVVSTQDISCWGIGSDVHVTSVSYCSWSNKKANGFVSKIKKCN